MKPQRILIIRRDNIGDLVCTTPAIAALRKHYPDAEIGVLVNSYNAAVLRGNPNVDQIFVYQKLKHLESFGNKFKALSERFKLIVRLRRWKPDITILAKASFDLRGLNFARQIGAKHIIGYVPDDLNQAKGLPDIQIPTPNFTSLHEVEAISQLLVPLGINDALGPLQVFPDAKSIAEISAHIPVATKRIALHISAREPERRWGISKFIALSKHILESYPDTQILLFWSPGKADDPRHPGDDESAELLVQTLDSGRLVPMPTQNLTDLIAALSLCELFIGADGGGMHLAAALNKRVLALFERRPDKLSHWYPWKVESKTVSSTDPETTEVGSISQQQTSEMLECLLNQEKI